MRAAGRREVSTRARLGGLGRLRPVLRVRCAQDSPTSCCASASCCSSLGLLAAACRARSLGTGAVVYAGSDMYQQVADAQQDEPVCCLQALTLRRNLSSQ